jgi:hypothetical protein
MMNVHTYVRIENLIVLSPDELRSLTQANSVPVVLALEEMAGGGSLSQTRAIFGEDFDLAVKLFFDNMKAALARLAPRLLFSRVEASTAAAEMRFMRGAETTGRLAAEQITALTGFPEAWRGFAAGFDDIFQAILCCMIDRPELFGLAGPEAAVPTRAHCVGDRVISVTTDPRRAQAVFRLIAALNP